jgi:CspA family cold shock protein
VAEGSIKRLTEKGFGFIGTAEGNDLFFHSTALSGVTFEELRVGQRVEYTVGQSARGPRAEAVRLV